MQAHALHEDGHVDWSFASCVDIEMLYYYLDEFVHSLEQCRIATKYYFEFPHIGKKTLATMLARVKCNGCAETTIEKLLHFCTHVGLGQCGWIGSAFMQNAQYSAVLS